MINAIVQNRKRRRPKDRDLAFYERHYINGESALTIANEAGLSGRRVWEILQDVADWVAEEFKNDIYKINVLHTRRLERIYAESVQAYERSKRPAEKEETTVESEAGEVAAQPPHGQQAGPPVDGKRKHKTTKTHRDGDPRYYEQARGALQDIRDIWGCDAPKKVAPTDTEGNTLTLATFLGLAAARHEAGPPSNVIDVDVEYARLTAGDSQQGGQVAAQPHESDRQEHGSDT